MISYSAYNLKTEDLAREVNKGKDLILELLAGEKVITEDQLRHYKLYYGVVIGEPSYFSRLWKTLFPKRFENKTIYMMVKLLNVSGEEEQEKVDITKSKGD